MAIQSTAGDTCIAVLFAIRIINPLTVTLETIGNKAPYCALVVSLLIVRFTQGAEVMGVPKGILYSVIAFAAHAIVDVRPLLKLSLSAFSVKLLFNEVNESVNQS